MLFLLRVYDTEKFIHNKQLKIIHNKQLHVFPNRFLNAIEEAAKSAMHICTYLRYIV